MGELEIWHLGNLNFYNDGETHYSTAYRELRTYWASQFPFMTEVQLVTKNVHAVAALNHPFDISKIAQYPSSAHQIWVHNLFLKAGIVDMRQRLKK